MDVFTLNSSTPRVIIVGGGFGGLEVAQRINTRRYDVLLLDCHNYFTFQPLLYQVATGGLEPDSVAYPIRKVINRRHRKIAFRMAEVQGVDTENNLVISSIGTLPFNILILACGSVTNFFNMQALRDNALSLKSVTDALNIRSFILQNFERALLSRDREQQKRLMNFVIIGGGPTGVEVAGSLAELKRHVLPHDYPELDLSMMDITIVEAGKNVLDVMSEKAKKNSKIQLEELGVKMLFETQLVNYDGETATFKDGSTMATSSLIWTAGVKGNVPPGFAPDLIVRGNRLAVDAFNRVKGFTNIYAIGDIAAMQPDPLPMLAPVAMQQGKHLAKNLNKAGNDVWLPFKYKDKGTMATIGRSRAVADLKFTHLKGFLAWIAWLFIHLMLLVGFRNRVIVFINWVWNYFSYDKAIRLIIRPSSKGK